MLTLERTNKEVPDIIDTVNWAFENYFEKKERKRNKTKKEALSLYLDHKTAGSRIKA